MYHKFLANLRLQFFSLLIFTYCSVTFKAVMKILLVDDDPALVTIFQTALQEAGFEVSSAANAKDGIERAKAEKPALIIMDQILPDMPGNDVLKLLKESADTKDIPVAMMSNYSDETIMKNAIAMGAVDYIYKYNVEPSDVVAKVKQLTSASAPADGSGTPSNGTSQPPTQ